MNTCVSTVAAMNTPVDAPASAWEPPASSTATGTTGSNSAHEPKAAATATNVGMKPDASQTELTSAAELD